jgi:outer membrane receptor protein involved in Fe transport
MFSDGPFQLAVLPGRSSFAVFDVGVGYRLPGRRGIVEVGVRNLTDRKFLFQDVDLRNPTIARRRLVAARALVDF